MDEIVLREELARAAYEAYGAQRSWKTHDGKPMPEWAEVGEYIQEAWGFAARAVEEKVLQAALRSGRYFRG